MTRTDAKRKEIWTKTRGIRTKKIIVWVTSTKVQEKRLKISNKNKRRQG